MTVPFVTEKLLDGSFFRKTVDDDDRAWAQLLQFIWPKREPTKEDLVPYLFFLKRNCKLGLKSIWIHLMLLGSASQRHFSGLHPMDFHQIQHYSMVFNMYCCCPAHAQPNYFSPEEIDQFLEINDPHVSKGLDLLRKCYAVLGYYGQMHSYEAWDLSYDDVLRKSDGFLVMCLSRKKPFFHVPYHHDPSLSRAQHVRDYLDFYQQCLEGNTDGPLFRTILIDGTLSTKAILYHSLYLIEGDIARTIGLPNPKSYSGHGFAGPKEGRIPEPFTPALQEKYKWVDALVWQDDSSRVKKRKEVMSYRYVLENAEKLLWPDHVPEIEH